MPIINLFISANYNNLSAIKINHKPRMYLYYNATQYHIVYAHVRYGETLLSKPAVGVDYIFDLCGI